MLLSCMPFGLGEDLARNAEPPVPDVQPASATGATHDAASMQHEAPTSGS